MLTAAVRKSVTDLTCRRARALFTIATLALAVASVGIFAVPPVMQQAMDEEVAANRSADLIVSMEPQRITSGDLAALRRLPNVTAVEPRSTFATRVWVGERRERAVVIGVADFARQDVDVVRVAAGAPPGPDEVLTDRNNADAKGYGARVGERVRILAADGREHRLAISGVGRNLTDGEDDPSNDWITLYASPGTVADLSGAPGVTSLALRLGDARRPAAERTAAAVRERLRATTTFTGFSDLPLIQEEGTYPGQESFESLASILGIITLLALLTALVLVSNTMTTLVGEQTGEIASMKAIGAQRRDIRRIYLRTAVLLGALGAAAGAVLGVLLANALVGFFASEFFGVDAAFGLSVPVVVGALVLGLLGPPLAALPAIRRATRLPLHEALSATGSASGPQGRVDAALRRLHGVPRSVQIGLRGVGRRKRRASATAIQVAVAVATLLSLLSVGSGVAETTRGWFDDNRWDTWIQAVASKQMGPDAERVIRATPGVRDTQAWVSNDARLEGQDVSAWGLPARPLVNTRVDEGRWYGEDEVRAGARVAVLGRTIARTTGTEVGDTIEVGTGGGPLRLRVIGLSGNQADNGGVLFLPITTLQRVLGTPGVVNNHWIVTSSDDHDLIDRTTTALEDRLAARGNQVGSIVNHDAREDQIAANRMVTTSITVLGLLIVAISMVGLVNAITMAVLERTREIGMLRSVGARARDVRRIFATEGLVVAVAGWALGVPLGYVLARVFGWAAGEAVGLDIVFVFPLLHVLIALVGTVLLALLVMLPPVRRAVRFRPGDALRHA